MPATRTTQDRADKREEIVTAARKLFLEDGYEQTSMSALAKASGVAGNTIYWYFTDKDDVLIAVLDNVMSEAAADYEDVSTQPLDQQLLWVVDQLRQMHRLVATVHARADRSPTVHAWHQSFHTVTETLLRAALEQTATCIQDLDAETKIAVFTIEGLITHPLERSQREAICHRLARRPA